jgi:hypothetical protein
MPRAIAWIILLAGLAVAVLGAAAGGFLHYLLAVFAAAYDGPLSWSSHLLHSLFWLVPLGAGAGLAVIGSLGFRPQAV